MIKRKRSSIRFRIGWTPEENQVIHDDPEQQRHEFVVQTEVGYESKRK